MFKLDVAARRLWVAVAAATWFRPDAETVFPCATFDGEILA
jgi:hypothetical protein